MMHERDEPTLQAIKPAAQVRSVSEILRAAREGYGQDLGSVAEVLRIRPAYLEAIEAGEFDLLPGPTYAVGFLRTYAEFLGLDSEAIVDQFRAETQSGDQRPELVFPEPMGEGKIPGGAIILISVLLLVSAYGGWFYLSNRDGDVADLIPALPDRLQALLQGEEVAGAQDAGPGLSAMGGDVPEDLAPVAPQNAMIPAADGESALAPGAAAPTEAPAPLVPEPAGAAPEAPAAQPSAAPPAVGEPVAAPEPSAATGSAAALAALPEAVAPPQAAEPPAEAAQPLPESAATRAAEETVVIPAPPAASETVIIPNDAPRIYGESNESARIVVRALQDSWVQVRDGQEALLLTRVLRAGDVYRVPDEEGLTLLTGNAGGIEIEVDGTPLPPIGPTGSVRRAIPLDPERLLEGAVQTP